MYRPTNIEFSTGVMKYESSTEFNLNRALEHIKQCQTTHKRELEKKDELILTLQKRIEALQTEGRDFTELRRLHEKELRELVSSYQYLEHKYSIEQCENAQLKEDLNRLRQDLSVAEDKIAHLDGEKDKANHIIKNLLKKIQN